MTVSKDNRIKVVAEELRELIDNELYIGVEPFVKEILYVEVARELDNLISYLGLAPVVNTKEKSNGYHG